MSQSEIFVKDEVPLIDPESNRVGLEEYKPRIIVADDDTDIRTLIRVALRRENYEVVEAATGAELLEIVGAWILFCDGPRPDAIVSDVRMPGFSGTTVLSGLRASDWKTPFVLMTAFGSDELERHARELGADAFYRKPFDVLDLVRTLNTLLHNLRTGSPDDRLRFAQQDFSVDKPS